MSRSHKRRRSPHAIWGSTPSGSGIASFPGSGVRSAAMTCCTAVRRSPSYSMIPIATPSCSSGNSDESVVLFCARVDSTAAAGVHGLPEEHEDIRVVVKTLAEIEALIDAGGIESGHTLIGLHWLLRHRNCLRRLWPTR